MLDFGMPQVQQALCACLLATAANHAIAQVVTAPNVDDTEFADSLFTIVEVSPAFPGGETELYKYLLPAIRYPEAARDAGIQGTVFVNFVVEKDGSITNANVLRGIGGGCDEVALNAVRSMPVWTPGEHKGQKVRVRYNLPVKFTIKEPVPPLIDTVAFIDPVMMPSFPGGEAELRAFIKANLRYPTEAAKEGIIGDVYTTFEVDPEGNIRDPKVLRGVHPSIDTEALRLLSAMPRWNPGMLNDKPVRVQFTLPIRFSPK